MFPPSVRRLQASTYSEAQREAALGPVFAVDRQLIHDRSYFVAEHEGALVGCGGWSRRTAVFGGDRKSGEQNAELDPATEPARVRAFFVHPQWARRGIGRRLLDLAETALRQAGFKRAILVATLAGEPLYAAAGYAVEERLMAPLVGGLSLPVVRMRKNFGEGPGCSGGSAEM